MRWRSVSGRHSNLEATNCRLVELAFAYCSPDVEASAVIMIFVSKGYFKSKNCLREVDATVKQKKPLCLVFDPVQGPCMEPHVIEAVTV